MMIKECNQLIRQKHVIKENIKEHNRNCPQIPDHPYRILRIGGSGSGKANSLFYLINNHQPDIDKIYLYAKDSYETKYPFLIKKRKDVGTKHFNDSKHFVEYSNDMDDIYKNNGEYNTNKNRKMLIVFYGIIVDMLRNEKPNHIVTGFIYQRQNFTCPKNIRVNSTQYFITKIPTYENLNKVRSFIYQILILKTF